MIIILVIVAYFSPDHPSTRFSLGQPPIHSPTHPYAPLHRHCHHQVLGRQRFRLGLADGRQLLAWRVVLAIASTCAVSL
ncbi:hypothetical protein [Nodosilinea sp. P-1105]|uniref:hypothetical protein n=1 Tax=Nodosilinea sp. P-1105 TaxID=2546229 RepID=UPI00146C60C7|nr:hypothetical protein [Nodosilinea sp. P-1105]NMF86018.1 hypothetical protein [Nodosilinea sp. P-1105]